MSSPCRCEPAVAAGLLCAALAWACPVWGAPVSGLEQGLAQAQTPVPSESAAAGKSYEGRSGDASVVDSAALVPAEAGDAGPRWSAMALWSAQARQGHERFNPGNVARMPRSAEQVALIIDGLGPSWSARARLQADARDTGAAGEQATAWQGRFDITQLKWTHSLGEDWRLVVGRINLSLDDGQSFHPLDFFEDMIRGTDLEDRKGRSLGFPMMMIERALPASGWRLIYSDDRMSDTRAVYGDPNPNFNRGLRQVLLSWRRSEGAWTWTTLLNRPWPGRGGFGGSFSWVPASAWAFHGAAFAAPGNPLPVHQDVVTAQGRAPDARDIHLTDSPMAPWLAADGLWRWRALLGAQFTGEDADTWLIELWRDQRGMNAAQWDTWRRWLDFHDRLPQPLARRINLAYDLQALRVPSGPHVFTQYRHGLEGGGELRASVLWAQDGSGTLSLRWLGRARSWGDFSLEGWQRFGAAVSRYGVLPDRRGAELVVRLLF